MAMLRWQVVVHSQAHGSMVFVCQTPGEAIGLIETFKRNYPEWQTSIVYTENSR